jgi:hypothetical protein
VKEARAAPASDEDEASLERSQAITVSVGQLIDNLKQRGHARLARERKAADLEG